MFRFRRHSRKALVVICTICTVAVNAVLLVPPTANPLLKPIFGLREMLGRAELRTQDFLATNRYAKSATLRDDLVYLAIDSGSLTLDGVDATEVASSPALGLMKKSWPWPRAIYPLIIDRLLSAGVRAVGFDLLFPSPSENDEPFREALEKFRGRVVIGSNFVDQKNVGGTLSKIYGRPSTSLFSKETGADEQIGFVNFWPDEDEVIRHARYRVLLSEASGIPPDPDEKPIDSLGAQLLRKANFAAHVPPGTAPYRIRFAGPPGTFEPYSIYEIFFDRTWKTPRYANGEFFKNKIVLIGPQGNFFKDFVLTPYGYMNGPEVHLNALNAALTGSFVRELSARGSHLLIIFAGALAWLICVCFPAPLTRIALFALTGAAWLVTAQALYNHASLFIVNVGPMLAFGSGSVMCLAWDFFREQREKAHVRGTLERYVSRDVVKEIIDNPASYFQSLGGVRKSMAFLFSDLRGFTAMTEQTDCASLVAQLNEYFSAMVEPILAHEGVLDKFIGDAIMAVWGSIRTRGAGEDVRAAISTALQMRAALARLNERWRRDGKREFAMGMGINFGEAIVGNIGSMQRMNLTVIGDAVNLASRLEGVTKEYGIDLLLGEDAAALARDFFHLQTVGLVQVKGRSKPAGIFTVLGEREKPLNEATAEYLHTFEEAMGKYVAGDFAGASALFEKCAALRIGDPLARVYIERCAALVAHPPEKNWNGVFVMTKK